MNTSNKRYVELISRYLDDDLDDAQFAEFQSLLRNRDFSRLLAEHCLDHVSLHEFNQTGRLSTLTAVSPSRIPAWQLMLLGLAVSVMVAAVGWWGALRPLDNGVQRPHNAPADFTTIAIAKITALEGRVMANGQPIRVGMPVFSHHNISIEAMGGVIGIEFLDGTVLQLSGPAEFVCCAIDGQKQLYTDSGNMWLSVKPQPVGKPLLILTPKAVMEVVGTEIAISADTASTTLRVNHGHVVLRRTADGAQVDVKAQQEVTVSSMDGMRPERVIEVSDTWDVDFEHGLPQGWIAGELSDVEPGCVKAVSVSNRYGTNFLITSHARFTNGLFRIHDDSYLNYRIRMKRSGFYQVLFESRHVEFKGVIPNQEFQETNADWMKSGDWHTVSIPFSDFRNSVKSEDGTWPPFKTRSSYPQLAKLVPYLLQFSTLGEDLGLCVDRIWVTRGKPE